MRMLTVFQAFPNGIEHEIWQIGQMAYSTITGNALDSTTLAFIDAIVDEANDSEPNASPSAAVTYTDTLLYVRPEQMPTIDTAELIASYAVKNTQTDKLYAIIDAGIGKNQDNGVIEHIELRLRQIGAA